MHGYAETNVRVPPISKEEDVCGKAVRPARRRGCEGICADLIAADGASGMLRVRGKTAHAKAQRAVLMASGDTSVLELAKGLGLVLVGKDQWHLLKDMLNKLDLVTWGDSRVKIH